MQTATAKCGTTLQHGAAILMARLVDGGGAPIRPEHVHAIECSIFEVDPCWPNNLSIVPDYHAISLDVADVVFDSPQIGESWTVDEMGYNFRHEIACRHGQFPKTSFRYEVRYVFTIASGRQTVVRFILGC